MLKEVYQKLINEMPRDGYALCGKTNEGCILWTPSDEIIKEIDEELGIPQTDPFANIKEIDEELEKIVIPPLRLIDDVIPGSVDPVPVGNKTEFMEKPEYTFISHRKHRIPRVAFERGKDIYRKDHFSFKIYDYIVGETCRIVAHQTNTIHHERIYHQTNIWIPVREIMNHTSHNPKKVLDSFKIIADILSPDFKFGIKNMKNKKYLVIDFDRSLLKNGKKNYINCDENKDYHLKPSTLYFLRLIQNSLHKGESQEFLMTTLNDFMKEARPDLHRKGRVEKVNDTVNLLKEIYHFRMFKMGQEKVKIIFNKSVLRTTQTVLGTT